MSQEQRDRVMGRLRGGTADLLVATDVAARGLDIDQLTHVVNYDVPSAPEAYVHRIGRVGRAGREGVAITLAEPREHRLLKTIERVTRQRITVEKVPTVADLRARRLELTRAALHESLLEPTTSTGSGSSSRRSPTSSTSMRGRAGRGEAGPRGQRRSTDDEEEIPDGRRAPRPRRAPAARRAGRRGRGRTPATPTADAGGPA